MLNMLGTITHIP